jgi:hypothetical protein
VPAAATAKSYCVNDPGCVSAGGEGVGSGGEALQTALTDAETGEGNQVLVGPGVYSRSGGYSYAGKALTIEGAGAGSTIITRNHQESAKVMMINVATTIAGLTIEIPESSGPGPSETNKFMTGLSLGGGLARRISLDAPGGAENAIGVSMQGGTLAQSTIEVPRGDAVEAAGPGASVSDSTIFGAFGVASYYGPTTIARCRIAATAFGFAIGNYHGTVSAEDTLIDLDGAGGAQGLYNQADISQSAASALRNDTIVNGGANSYGIWAYAGAGRESKVEVFNSIISEVAHPLKQQAFEAGSTVPIAVSYSSIPTAEDESVHENSASPPAAPVEENPVITTPSFVQPFFGTSSPFAGNWRLAPGSPLIDAGAPGGLGAGESGSDLAGNPRIAHGRRDVGAYEYGWRGPAVSASANVSKPVVGQPVLFAGSAEALEAGDAVASSRWTFDDGSSVPGGSAVHAFSTPGVHSATLTATDSLGVTGTATVTVTVMAPPQGGGPGSGAHAAALVLSDLRIGHRAFRALGRGGSVTNGRGGTLVSYRLSEAASLTFTVQRRARGVLRGRSCVARARKGRRARRCTRYVTLPGSFVVSGAKGRGSFRFSGRLGGGKLVPGSYRLVALARDTGGATSVGYAAFKVVP